MKYLDDVNMNWIQQLRRLDDERTVAGVFLIAAVYMFIESFTFSWQTAAWPRFISVIATIGCVAIIVQQWVPATVRSVITESYQIVEAEDDEVIDSTKEADKTDFSQQDAIFTALTILGFGLMIIVAGYMVATLFFIVLFSYYFDISLGKTVIILLICLGTIYYFAQGLNIAIFEGFLL